MIRFATEADRDAVCDLWERCFPDDSGFNPYYLTHLLDLPHTLLCEADGSLAAMAQMLPYTLRTGVETVSATYIYGACTHPDFRRRHLMSKLLEASFRLDREAGRAASILIPQEAWLFDFYRPFGYEPAFFLGNAVHTVTRCTSARFCTLTEVDLPALERLYRAATTVYDPVVLRTPAQWLDQISLFNALGLGAFGLRNPGGSLAAYAFVWRNADSLWAQEFIACSDADRDALLAALAQHAGLDTIRTSGPATGGEALGCIRWHNRASAHQGYFNLMLN